MMIFFVADDGASPVNLLRKHKANELMRKSQLGETPGKIRPFQHSVIQAKSSTNKEYKVLHTFIGTRL